MLKFVLLLLVLAGGWYFWSGQHKGPQEPPPPMPVEETFIADQVKALDTARGFEGEYLEATDAQKQRLEEQLQRAEGG